MLDQNMSGQEEQLPTHKRVLREPALPYLLHNPKGVGLPRASPKLSGEQGIHRAQNSTLKKLFEILECYYYFNSSFHFTSRCVFCPHMETFSVTSYHLHLAQWYGQQESLQGDGKILQWTQNSAHRETGSSSGQ